MSPPGPNRMPLGLFNAVVSAGVGLAVMLLVVSSMPPITVCIAAQ